MRSAVIVRNHRKSLEKNIEHFLNKIGIKYQYIDNRYGNISTIAKDIINQTPNRVIFSNGCDNRDIELVKQLKKLNNKQKYLFCENAWFPYSNYIYFDSSGIGNHSELFDKTKLYNNVFDKDAEKYLIKNLNECKTKLPDNYKNYVLVPLQVDGDSKMIIGSPYFKTVLDFVKYIIEFVPNDKMILFRNHPHNKKPIKIPLKSNVKDISKLKVNKQELISKADCVMGINSTLLMESIYLNKKVISFGLDIFSNKNLVLNGMNIKYEDIDSFELNKDNRYNLICELMSRQVPKTNTNVSISTFENHYWNENF